MRNRFFFIILATLVSAAIGINSIHTRFFRSQRLKLIDSQILTSSQTLLGSAEFMGSVEAPDTLEAKISAVLASARIGKVFILRRSDGKIVYQSENMSLLQTGLPLAPEWVTVETETEFIRIRNIPLPDHDPLILQVGLVLDRNFISWEILDNRTILYVTAIIASLFFASVLLTLTLLSPIRLLIAHLTRATSDLKNLKDVDPLPNRVTRFTAGFWSNSDEFANLIGAIQRLIDRINLNYKLTRSWTLQMAHELKTPLAVIRAETEAGKKSSALPADFSDGVLGEVDHMSEIINQFLDWAELESSQIQKDLHVLRMSGALKSVKLRLEKIHPGRLNMRIDDDFSVLANPVHIDQFATNLLTNALKFSPASEPVDVVVRNHELQIQDRGPGIHTEVLERLGQPFNVGISDGGDPRMKGNGLGLAWVNTVTKLYQWTLILENTGTGLRITVRFPPLAT